MPVGFRNGAGVDLETLFDPDVMGDGPTAPFLRRSNGTAIKFAAIEYGSKGPNVGYRDGSGVDVSNLWAAAGTASYVTDGGLPAGLSSSITVPPGEPAGISAGFQFQSNGLVSWTSLNPPPGSGGWTSGNPADYDIRFDIRSSNLGEGQLDMPPAGVRHRLNSNRAVNLGVETPGSASSSVSLRLRIYSRASGAVVVDRNIDIIVSVIRLV